MTDLALIWLDAEACADLKVCGGDLVGTPDLRSAVIVSLFTDRRAPADAGDEFADDPRGWWGDTAAEIAGDEIGSHLWLLAREKTTSTTLERARRYTQEALAWLITDGVARAVDVSATYPRPGVLALVVSVQPTRGPAQRFALALERGALIPCEGFPFIETIGGGQVVASALTAPGV